MKRSISVLLAILMGLLLFYGCGGKSEVYRGVKAPEWVVKGSGAFADERGKVFYGVASAYGIRNPSLLRQTADDRARNEVAKIFQFYTASLAKDYMASTMAGDPNATSEEQHVEQAIKTVTSMTLSGVEIVDHWDNPKTGELFSLARLDLAAFKNNLQRARELNGKVRDYIRQNADRLHKELEKEEDKMRER
ncbi:hypothetical protein BMS3Abin07_02193 [bacterium BMS3Abin07]|nr:hypothetical protein BMS3Abin07_02193 [bacterium BMS3Abin07]HDL21274.1 hypothetical protein [Nitrospirota bacterium]HDZ88670.1 hypothetical protein [Nitrospirota bacterium]